MSSFVPTEVDFGKRALAKNHMAVIVNYDIQVFQLNRDVDQ